MMVFIANHANLRENNVKNVKNCVFRGILRGLRQIISITKKAVLSGGFLDLRVTQTKKAASLVTLTAFRCVLQ